MKVLAKVLLYNLSLVPLYILFIVKKIDVNGLECIYQEYANIEFYKAMLIKNITSSALMFLILLSILAFYKLMSEVNSGYGLPEKLSGIRNIDFNHLTFIATYILPLLAFTLDTFRDLIFIVVLLSFIGIIYIKTNLYYLSPVFIIFNIKIFSAVNENEEEIIFMTTENNIKVEELMHYTKLGDIYIAKRTNR